MIAAAKMERFWERAAEQKSPPPTSFFRWTANGSTCTHKSEPLSVAVQDSVAECGIRFRVEKQPGSSLPNLKRRIHPSTLLGFFHFPFYISCESASFVS
jgi:hypothetical protein